MSEEADFQKHLPEITEMTTLRAAEAFGIGGEIISLNGKGCGLDAFMLVLANDQEQLGPFLLTNTSARALFRLLKDEGFGDPK